MLSADKICARVLSSEFTSVGNLPYEQSVRALFDCHLGLLLSHQLYSVLYYIFKRDVTLRTSYIIYGALCGLTKFYKFDFLFLFGIAQNQCLSP